MPSSCQEEWRPGRSRLRSAPARALAPAEAAYGFAGGWKTKGGFGENRPGSAFGSGSASLAAGGEAMFKVDVPADAAVTMMALPACPLVEAVTSLPARSR